MLIEEIKLKVIEWLSDTGSIPKNFLFNKDGSLRKLEKEIDKQLNNKLITYFKSDKISYKPIILTGQDSIQKDLASIQVLLWHVSTKNYTVQYYGHPNTKEMSDVWVTAIMRIDMLVDKFQTDRVKTKLTEIITNNKSFIISCSSLKSIEEVFGKSFTNFLIGNSIQITMPEIELKMVSI